MRCRVRGPSFPFLIVDLISNMIEKWQYDEDSTQAVWDRPRTAMSHSMTLVLQNSPS